VSRVYGYITTDMSERAVKEYTCRYIRRLGFRVQACECVLNSVGNIPVFMCTLRCNGCITS